MLLGLLLMLDGVLVGALAGLYAELDGLAIGDRRRDGVLARIDGLEALRGFLTVLLARVLAARAFARGGGPLTLRRLYGRARMIARALVGRQIEDRWAVAVRVVRVRPRRAVRVARRRRPTDRVTQKTARGAAMTRAWCLGRGKEVRFTTEAQMHRENIDLLCVSVPLW